MVFRPTPLKNHGVSNSWDDDIPYYSQDDGKVIKFYGSKMFQTTNQWTNRVTCGGEGPISSSSSFCSFTPAALARSMKYTWPTLKKNVVPVGTKNVRPQISVMLIVNTVSNWKSVPQQLMCAPHFQWYFEDQGRENNDKLWSTHRIP